MCNPDVALNNLQVFICQKKTTNQPTNQKYKCESTMNMIT